MSKIAFIYPGQGAQTVGMGKDFYDNSATAKDIFDKANELLDFNLLDICFEENQLINETEYTQPALVTTCIAITKELENIGIKPNVTAGLSLGEYAALYAAGGITSMDAITTVRKRGIFMSQAVPDNEGTMMAVLGMNKEQVEQVISSIEGVTIANYNCPGQIVITGLKDAVIMAGEKLSKAGARRTVELKVSGPFHSPYLKEAGNKLKKELEKIKLTPLKVPYVANLTADYVNDISMTKELLKKQVYSPVKWEQTMEKMIADGVDTFVEIGPGRTLSGFLRKIDRTVKVHNVSKFEDIEKVKEQLC